MTIEERDEIYQRLPFLEQHVPKSLGLRPGIEEVSGDLNLIRIDPTEPRHHLVARTIRLLDKDGNECGQVGKIEEFRPPLKIFSWKFGGGTKTIVFKETVMQAIQRMPTPIFYLLITYARGSTFRLFTAPEGKNIAEWAAEKDHLKSIPEFLAQARIRAEAQEKTEAAKNNKGARLEADQ